MGPALIGVRPAADHLRRPLLGGPTPRTLRPGHRVGLATGTASSPRPAATGPENPQLTTTTPRRVRMSGRDEGVIEAQRTINHDATTS